MLSFSWYFSESGLIVNNITLLLFYRFLSNIVLELTEKQKVILTNIYLSILYECPSLPKERKNIITIIIIIYIY